MNFKNQFGLFWLMSIMLVACSDEQVAEQTVIRPVKAMQVADVSGLSDRSFPGRAKATEQIDLSFDVSGKLTERPVNIGDTIEKGQIIARLDPRDFRAKLKSARAELQRDIQNFKRANDLIKKDFISKSEFDRLEASVDIAEANVDLARKALSDSVIKAPFSGRIAKLYVENYQAVRAKENIARLLDTSKIEIIIDIPENLISNAPFIKNIKVRFDAFPGIEVPATIKEISNEASENTRTYPVTLIMEQPEGVEILPGMAGKAKGEAHLPDKTNKGFYIPLSAVFSADESNNSYVWVIDEKNQTVNKREITTEALSQYGIKVIKGLQAGEWIATAGVHYLQQGQKISILSEPEAQQ